MLAKRIKALHSHPEFIDDEYLPTALHMPAWEGLIAGTSQYATECDEEGEYPEVDEFGVWRMVPMERASTYTTFEESGL